MSSIWVQKCDGNWGLFSNYFQLLIFIVTSLCLVMKLQRIKKLGQNEVEDFEQVIRDETKPNFGNGEQVFLPLFHLKTCLGLIKRDST